MRNEASSSSTDLTRTLSRKRLHKAKEYRKAKKKPILDEVGTSCDISLENGAVDRTYERDSEGSNDASDSGDLIDDESSRRIDFDIEAFPMESGDREGVVNMLTQIFLRADIDLEGFANSIIAQSPLGLVFGPAEDQSEEESENVVYGVVTAVSLINLGNAPKFMKDILDFLEMKSRKFALKEFRDALEVAKSKRTGIFINERMLNFPYQIVKPSFSSIKSDLGKLKKPYQKMIYIHKLRIEDRNLGLNMSDLVHDKPLKKKRKLGKAEKRRMTIRDLSNADVVFDNVEDKILYQICEGEANFFDYPVHSEVESSSKFHILVKDGKSYKPYRRVVVMDIKRFDAFLEQVINGVF